MYGPTKEMFRIMRRHPDKMPPLEPYSRLLTMAVDVFDITRDQARERYGMYTNKQWLELFNWQ